MLVEYRLVFFYLVDWTTGTFGEIKCMLLILTGVNSISGALCPKIRQGIGIIGMISNHAQSKFPSQLVTELARLSAWEYPLMFSAATSL